MSGDGSSGLLALFSRWIVTIILARFARAAPTAREGSNVDGRQGQQTCVCASVTQ